MRKSVAIFMAVAFLFAIGGVVVAGTAPDVIKLSANYKGGLDFTHAKHVTYAKDDCKACHHTGENVGCKGCHDATGSKANGMKAKNAFHKQCKDCHKKAGKGPTGCKDCHAG
jgi:Class III cytochrome C family